MIYVQDTDFTLHQGDCLEVLQTLPDGSVQMCCTSPPFYGLRDYGTGSWQGGDEGCDHLMSNRYSASTTLNAKPTDPSSENRRTPYRDTCGRCGARRVDRQIGLEDTPEQWVARLVDVFREVRRVLRDDGTLWVEIGDSYAAGKTGRADGERRGVDGFTGGRQFEGQGFEQRSAPPGYKPKDLLGQPWMLAFALRADGWWLRSEIIWNKPNPMPESVTDRPTKSHSTVFLLAKQPRYYFDADAIREPHARLWDPAKLGGSLGGTTRNGAAGRNDGVERELAPEPNPAGANARSVWTIATEPTPFAHFATWPQKLCARMILAGTSEHGCCPQCGAPWTRETEVERVVRSHGGPSPSHTVVKGYSASSAMVTNALPKVRTTGWAPSCRHDRQPVPCTVLDPFGGSGTTALVARSLGRRSTLVELSGDYCALAARRLQQLSLLGEAAT